MMGKKKTAKMRGGGPVKKTAKMRGGGPVKKMAKGGSSKINQHKRMAMGEAVNMKDGGTMMYSRGYGVGEKGKRTPTTILDGMKKGGRVKKSSAGAAIRGKGCEIR